MNEASLRDWLALSEGSLGVEMATGKQLIPQMAVYFNKARPRLGNATGAPGFTRRNLSIGMRQSVIEFSE